MRINGRTPEEIKRNITRLVRCDCCPMEHYYGCSYEESTLACKTTVDTLALIKHYEQRIEKQNALLALMGITIPEEAEHDAP